jgi:hypothetical protein
MATKPVREHADFVTEWNATDPAERRQIRRLVRIGQPVETADQARLALGFAEFQQSRPWWRYFWFWFVPAVVIAMVAAMGIHPILIGIVLGAVASTIMIHRNFTRVAKINAAVGA